MLKDPKARRFAIMGAAGAVVALGLGWLALQDTFFRMAIKPPGGFSAATPPPAPDYTKPESWALRPAQLTPGGWETPWGVDVFFIHPTSAYAGDTWNAPIDDPAAKARLDDQVLPNHAGPFKRVGPIYAPRYRQAALYSELDVGGEGDRAFLLAYSDVLAAFDAYMAKDNRQRGVLLVGGGQGGLYAQKLLQDRFQQEPLRDRLAAAYIIDAALPADFPDKAVVQGLCKDAASIQCIVAWKSIVIGESDAAFRDHSPIWNASGAIAASKGHPVVCINPLSWLFNENLAPRTDHKGGARALNTTDEPAMRPNTLSARCRNGVLEVENPTASELRPGGGWGGKFKTPAYNLFYADIVMNASDRARAQSVWLDEFAPKPAMPLPPATTLEEEGIHRPGGEADPVPAQDGSRQ